MIVLVNSRAVGRERASFLSSYLHKRGKFICFSLFRRNIRFRKRAGDVSGIGKHYVRGWRRSEKWARGRERERGERADSFRFTIQFAAPRNLIKRFYVYYGQFYMCVYPRHIDSRVIGLPCFPSIIHKFHPLLGFLAFRIRPLLSPICCLTNRVKKRKGGKKEEEISNLVLEKRFPFFLFFHFLRAYSSFVSGRDGHRSCLSPRFYEGATTREPDVCVPPLYDRLTRNGLQRNGIYAYAPVHLFVHFRQLPSCSTLPSWSSSLEIPLCVPSALRQGRRDGRVGVELLTTLARNNHRTGFRPTGVGRETERVKICIGEEGGGRGNGTRKIRVN